MRPIAVAFAGHLVAMTRLLEIPRNLAPRRRRARRRAILLVSTFLALGGAVMGAYANGAPSLDPAAPVMPTGAQLSAASNPDAGP